MNSTQLLYFVEAVKNNSMRKAAKFLNITQPNMSASIAALEKEVGVKLLIRSNKGIELTREGQKFYSVALGVTERMDVLRNMFLVENDPQSVILNIASKSSQIVTDLLARVHKSHAREHFCVTVRNLTIYECANSVSRAQSEIGIVISSSGYGSFYRKHYEEVGLEYTPISVKPYCINISRHNPYFERDCVTRQEIIQFPIARLIEDEFSYLDFSISTEGIGMGNNNRVYYFNSDSQVIDFISQTDAYKVGNPWCPNAYEARGIRCLNLVPDDGLPLELGWIKRKGYDLSAAARDFIGLLEETYRTL